MDWRYKMDHNKQTQWCAKFARRVRRKLYAIMKTDWYDYLLFTVSPQFVDRRTETLLSNCDVLEKESRAGLDDFLSLFSHLNLPEGTTLGVKGEDLGLGGYVKLMIVLPNGSMINPSEIKHDSASVESIWEKTMLRWASSQFYLFWHDGYNECVVLTGPASQVEKDIKHVSFHGSFLDAVYGEDNELMPLEYRQLFTKMDFSPKVALNNNAIEIEYYVYNPFSGISKYIALEEGCCSDGEDMDSNRVIPHWCGVCY
jgi:hypothetical protein